MIDNFIARQFARRHDNHFPTVRIIASNLNNPVLFNIAEILVGQVFVLPYEWR